MQCRGLGSHGRLAHGRLYVRLGPVLGGVVGPSCRRRGEGGGMPTVLSVCACLCLCLCLFLCLCLCFPLFVLCLVCANRLSEPTCKRTGGVNGIHAKDDSLRRSRDKDDVSGVGGGVGGASAAKGGRRPTSGKLGQQSRWKFLKKTARY